ncbi:hypothetical protein [Flavobacterium sp. ASW18X]|uniref:hypothetical protein n=1 Tax=Flavobacterium sp. ASW18X TaxID=2572595 RepID=UPI0010AE4BAE|nr:hypothetical protein [Flavobacterium sp. ASW18X]TKD60459.1 hypothetical protein FBT53_12690 [Flavobacterium sp. ASW18X]
MIKKTLRNLSIILSIISFSGYSQMTLDLPTDYVRNQVFNVNGLTNGNNYDGSPYLYTSFVTSIIKNKMNTYQVPTRFNTYNNTFELKLADQISTLKKEEYQEINVDNHTYIAYQYKNEPTYFEVLSSGSHTLLALRKTNFIESKAATTTYGTDKPARFSPSTTYFYFKENSKNIKELKLKKKEVLNIFDSKKNMNLFFKENKINLKKETDLIKLFSYSNKKV